MKPYEIYISPKWDGTYCIEEHCLQDSWGIITKKEVATGLKTIEEARERVKFMRREKFLVDGKEI